MSNHLCTLKKKTAPSRPWFHTNMPLYLLGNYPIGIREVDCLLFTPTNGTKEIPLSKY